MPGESDKSAFNFRIWFLFDTRAGNVMRRRPGMECLMLKSVVVNIYLLLKRKLKRKKQRGSHIGSHQFPDVYGDIPHLGYAAVHGLHPFGAFLDFTMDLV
jgi:hypothetical protein